MQRMVVEELNNKWGEILDHTSAGVNPIKDKYRRYVTAQLLENTERDVREAAAYGSTGLLTENNTTGTAISNFDPVMVALVRRAMPNLIAYDICGVQPMTGPTGLIFAMRSRYTNQTGPEAFYNEANTAFSTVTAGSTAFGQANGNIGTDPTNGGAGANTSQYNFGTGMSTAQAEALGTAANVAWSEMGLSIEKITVTAKSRALKAEYTLELAQDLKAIHGLDAEGELANMLSTEILAEINREVIRTIYTIATPGAQQNTATPGTFDLDVDANGRWMVEKFKGLMYQCSREGNAVAKATRRGRGNIIICSSDVASALQMAGVLQYTPALEGNQMQIDDTGNTFVGVLNGQFRVYIDPYSTAQYMVVGYKGMDPRDAGLFYAPYVPLQMARAVDPGSLQPIIGFKTRYGMVANPYAEGLTQGLGALDPGANVYYRLFNIANLM